MLYIVATPIGNLKDITLRAIETLKKVDLIAAEDTRHTRKLTEAYGITRPLTSYFEHNKITKAQYLITELKKGKDVALVSDSGTPGISDPGFRIIKLAKENNIEVTMLPGASALINALVLSGAPSHKFIFEGFLPPKKSTRLKRFKELQAEARTMIFYESPHRLIKFLEDAREVFGDAKVVIARELTKKFEEILDTSLDKALSHFAKSKPKGEFVLIFPKNK